MILNTQGRYGQVRCRQPPRDHQSGRSATSSNIDALLAARRLLPSPHPAIGRAAAAVHEGVGITHSSSTPSRWTTELLDRSRGGEFWPFPSEKGGSDRLSVPIEQSFCLLANVPHPLTCKRSMTKNKPYFAPIASNPSPCSRPKNLDPSSDSDYGLPRLYRRAHRRQTS